MPAQPARQPAPPPLTVAASLVVVEGIVLVALAVAEMADLASERLALGLSTSLFFAAYAAVLLVSGWALWRAQPWSRGPVLLTQLIMLGLAWNLRDLPLAAVALAVVAVVVLAGAMHPASIAALEQRDHSA